MFKSLEPWLCQQVLPRRVTESLNSHLGALQIYSLQTASSCFSMLINFIQDEHTCLCDP